MLNDSELYAGNSSNFVRYLNLWTGTGLDFSPPHLDTVTSLAILGDTLVSGSKDKNLWFWDISSGNCLSTTYNAHRDSITCLASDWRFVYSGCWDGTIKAWELPAVSGWKEEEERELDP